MTLAVDLPPAMFPYKVANLLRRRAEASQQFLVKRQLTNFFYNSLADAYHARH
jgi:hypothetical protein